MPVMQLPFCSYADNQGCDQRK
ncbi:hypothetical protein FMEAI12_1740011 [Parafrankia sp. Ea1.12]|nr:hypothetical protein FMEAI12_1740011 [Parafrankia sp. Ea1.12]